jgi:hypothetical protein
MMPVIMFDSMQEWQHARMAACKNGNIALACSFIFRVNRLSTNATPNANGTI